MQIKLKPVLSRQFLPGLFLLLLLVVCWQSLIAAPATHKQAISKPFYTFGAVPQFAQRKLYKIWRPILDALEKQTGLKFRLISSLNIPTFEKKFLAGNFDFTYINPYYASLGFEKYGYQPLVRDGSRRLKGILVVRKNGPIHKLADLQGRKIAFPAPNAIGASLLMRKELSLDHLLTFTPVYVQTHSSVYLHVAMGDVVAGGGVLSTLQRQPAAIRDKLRILYTTRSMSPHPVVAHPRVPANIREKVKQAFLALGRSKKGRALLKKVPINQIAPAYPADYADMTNWRLEDFYVKP